MKELLSLGQAREIIRAISPLPAESISLAAALGKVAAQDIVAESDCPSIDSSLKDGYAVWSDDVTAASSTEPVQLKLRGTLTAGHLQAQRRIVAGEALRIMTGAGIPAGANAVLSSEFAKEQGAVLTAFRDAHAGRNIMPRGADVKTGAVVVEAGTVLTPTHVGLLASAGVSSVTVHRVPRVMIAATGSELVEPGAIIEPGKVAASNMVTLQAELMAAGIGADTLLIHDDLDQLQQKLGPLLEGYDAVLTCGGVLDGDKDLTMRAMDGLRVEPVFRRCRVGPGKGICMGKKGQTLVFNLPGGPPSNHVAFMLLALPGLRRRAGFGDPFGRQEEARITQELRGQLGWTQIVYGRTERGAPIAVRPLIDCSRLQAMAAADCLIELPEDVESLAADASGGIWRIR